MKSFNKLFAASLALLICVPAMGMQSVSNSSLVKAANDHPIYAAGIFTGAALGIGAAYLYRQGKLSSTVKAVKDASQSEPAKTIQAYAVGLAAPIATSATLNYVVDASGSYKPYASIVAIPAWFVLTSKSLSWYAKAMQLDSKEPQLSRQSRNNIDSDESEQPQQSRKNRRHMGNAAMLSGFAYAVNGFSPLKQFPGIMTFIRKAISN